jgi:integrase
VSNLSVESIRRLSKRPVKRRVADSAARGLNLMIEPTGTKRWVLRYKVKVAGGFREHLHALGAYGENPGFLSLPEARRVAIEWRQRIRTKGEYPHEVAAREKDLRERERRAREEAPTVADLVKLFRERYLVPKTRRPDERLAAIEKYLIPRLGTTKLADVRRRDLNGVLDDLVAAGRHVTAYQLARLLGQMFRWGVDREYLEVSPAERLQGGSPHTPRDRVLSEDEIRTFWSEFNRTDLGISTAIRLALKVMLLTGVRSKEIAIARWSDVSLNGDMPVWTIPATAAKNARVHLVPLSPTAVKLLTSLSEFTGDTDWLLPRAERVRGSERLTERKGEATGPLDSHSLATALRRALRDVNGLEGDDEPPAGFSWKLRPFGAHDLRRTLRTGLSRIGCSAEVAEATIGHTVRSMLVKTYDLYDRMPERRAALIDWDKEVRRILANKPTVVSMRDRQGRGN